jgi:hypothetical protein
MVGRVSDTRFGALPLGPELDFVLDPQPGPLLTPAEDLENILRDCRYMNATKQYPGKSCFLAHPSSNTRLTCISPSYSISPRTTGGLT